jgi:hypothetical protein
MKLGFALFCSALLLAINVGNKWNGVNRYLAWLGPQLLTVPSFELLRNKNTPTYEYASIWSPNDSTNSTRTHLKRILA